MTINHFIKDTIQVTQWLLAHFSKSKLYLAGHSWGSILALHVLQQRPDLFYTYYGISQVVNPQDEESTAYQHIREISESKKPAYYLSLHVSLVLRLGSRISSTLSIGFVLS